MKTPKKQFGSILIVLILFFIQFAFPTSVHAAGITVNTLTDENTPNLSCSLREAIVAANSDSAYNGCTGGAGVDTITFSVSGTITLVGSSLPAITSAMTIAGGGLVTLSGGNAVRIFEVQSPASLSLAGITLTNGNSGTAQGGAIYINSGATVSLTDLTVRNNTNAFNSLIGGTGGAGAIYNAGTLTVNGSTFSGNTTTGLASDGGAIMSIGRVNISNSTFYGNSAVTNNSGGTGGAIRLEGGAGPNIFRHVTFSGNANDATYGALDINNTSATLEFSILANSVTGLDCTKRGTGTLTSTNNLVENGATCSPAVTGDPSLDPGGLQDNGGPTPTLALMPGSIAIDALSESLLICGASTDQRGAIRPQDGNGNGTSSCDLGAFERGVVLQATTTTITADAPDSSVAGQLVSVTVTVSGGTAIPTGTVDITGADLNCTITLNAAGSGTCDVNFATVGAKTLAASYGGDSTHATSSDTEAHTVDLAATSTTITADTPDPSVVGQAITVNYSVTVNSPGSGTPTGNVTVTDGVDSCTGTVAAGTCAIALTTPGARTLTATYAGDTNFAGSVSADVAHTVNKISTTTTITADAPDPSVIGQAVTVNFTVTAASGTPTGNVTVTDGVDSCTGTVAAGTCAIALTTPGARTLTATYAGDTNFAGSISAGVTHTVNQAGTTTTITADTPDPSVIGQAVTVNFTVTAASGTPTGNVTVTDGVDSCVGTVAAGTCSIALTTPGARTLTATYAGDTNFGGSSDTETHTVNQAPAITSANNTTFTIGVAGSFTVTTTGIPTPTISHTAGALPSGVTFTNNGDGTATLAGTPAPGTVNTYTLTFVASNGTNPDASQTFTLTVNEAAAITSANNTVFAVGSLGTFTVTTSGSPAVTTITLGGDPLPANVTFVDNGNGTATLSGIPQVGTDGVYNLTFAASNSVGVPTTQNFTLTVNLPPPPKIVLNGIGSVPDSGGGYIAEAEIVTVGITRILVTFDQAVRNAGSGDPDSVTNTDNYILVRDNGDGIQTVTCAPGGGVVGGDSVITIDSINYSDGGGSGPFVATLNLNSGVSLLEGAYRLIVCGTTSITNNFGVALAGDGVNANTDFTRNFVIALTATGGGTVVEAKTLPTTGFPMGVVTDLPAHPAQKAYSAYGDLWLEIPKLDLKMSIVGVPQVEGTWDVSWLGADAGYLQGTAFPTWKGNTVLTAHVWDAFNNPGPFAKIKNLLYGDQVKIHAFGQVYTYEVRESRLVSPTNTRSVLKHEELDWVTLLTCEDYKVMFKNYTYRRSVRAVLVGVATEK